jgi:hypothetical protein
VQVNEAQQTRLEEASAIDLGFPHEMFTSAMPQQVIYGGAKVVPRRS